MLNEDWQELFQPWILERGRNYCISGCVTELKRDRDCIRAAVLGTQEYEVDILLDGGEVVEMNCTCPYAEEGASCKHMAAVLFALEEADMPAKREYQDNPSLPWRETLEKLSAEEMRTFLAQAAAGDPGLQERLVLQYGPRNPGMLLDSWEEQIIEIVRKNSTRSGYINYDHAWDFYNGLDTFLNDRAPALLASGRVMEGFRLVSMVYETIMEQGADDSDGSSSALTDTCEQLWRDLLDLSTQSEQEQIYQWFVKHLDAQSWCFGTDQVEDFLFSYQWSEPLLQNNLKLLDQRIAKRFDSNQEYALPELLTWRESTMESLGRPKEEIEAFWLKYRELPFVRNRELERSLECGAYDQAIELLLEGKEKDREDPWRVKRYSQKLIELYKITGQETLYEEELRFQVFSCDQQDLEYVKQLRAITPETQWPDLAEKLLAMPMMRTLRFELLAYDQQWRRLFNEIQQEGRLSRLDRYADSLGQWAPERVLDCYAGLLINEMFHASNRQAYRGLIAYLPRLQTFPNGKAVAGMLATLWRDQFPRRRAMLEELQKAGF